MPQTDLLSVKIEAFGHSIPAIKLLLIIGIIGVGLAIIQYLTHAVSAVRKERPRKKEMMIAATQAIDRLYDFYRKHGEHFPLTNRDLYPKEHSIDFTKLFSQHRTFKWKTNSPHHIAQGDCGTIDIDIRAAYSLDERTQIGKMFGALWFLAYRASLHGPHHLAQFAHAADDFVWARDTAISTLHQVGIHTINTRIADFEIGLVNAIFNFNDQRKQLLGIEHTSVHDLKIAIQQAPMNNITLAHQQVHDIQSLIYIVEHYIQYIGNIDRPLKAVDRKDEQTIQQYLNQLRILHTNLKNLLTYPTVKKDILAGLLKQLQGLREKILSEITDIDTHLRDRQMAA